MSKKDKRKTRPNSLPNRDELIAYIRENNSTTIRRDIARTFGVRGAERAKLRRMLLELQNDGLIERSKRQKWKPSDRLPPVTVIEVYDIDEDGHPLVRPVNWDESIPLPFIELKNGSRDLKAPGLGDRVLCRLQPSGERHYKAIPMRHVSKETKEIIGVFRKTKEGGLLESIERRNSKDIFISETQRGDAEDGELVLASLIPGRYLGMSRAKVIKRICDASSSGAISLIAIYEADIPFEFTESLLTAAENLESPKDIDRKDLREIPLITIDGVDARDFDDAVFAEPDQNIDNPDGWHIIVAIADVSWFVKPNSIIDREAYKRGNSVYFPDRVIPMLPPALSNNLCSLLPNQERACLAVDLWISKAGVLLNHKFQRAIIKSFGRFNYEQVENIYNGDSSPIPRSHIENLYMAFESLSQERKNRGTLELDLPERKIVLEKEGNIKSIDVIKRLNSHRLIEEFMITANIAAGIELTGLKLPAMFRIHDEPNQEKLEELRKVLVEFKTNLPKSKIYRASDFNTLLAKLNKTPNSQLINELILRSQSRAEYSPQNIGHFGLNIRKYAHFTSPIRRYADLLVHRGLIRGLGLDSNTNYEDQLPDNTNDDFIEIGEHISATDRRAVGAERNANDRYTAEYLSNHLGELHTGVISGVTKAGLFIRLDSIGAEGFVPASRLTGNRYLFDSKKHTLSNNRLGIKYRLGENVEIKIIEANGIKSSSIFEINDESENIKHQKKKTTRHNRKSKKNRKKRLKQ